MKFKVGDRVKLLPLKEILKIYRDEYYGGAYCIDDAPYGIDTTTIENYKNKIFVVKLIRPSFHEGHGMDIMLDNEKFGFQWPCVWFSLANVQLEFCFEGEENA